MISREGPASHRGGFTLVELLTGLAVVAVLAAVGVPAYLGFVQRAREAALMCYLREVHTGQLAWRLETEASGYSGDFDELEESGFIPDAQNFQRVRRRTPRRGPTQTSSSRLVQTYRLDLTAQEDSATQTNTYSITAYPPDRGRNVRWFYLDQTGMIRAGKGSVGPDSQPAS